MNNTRNGCNLACKIGSEMCFKCMSPEEIEAEIEAENRALEEMERGITLAELDFEEDSDFSLMTRPR